MSTRKSLCGLHRSTRFSSVSQTSKTLLILRHAEAGHSFSGDDHGRHLTQRGHEQAQAVGQWLREQNVAPEAAMVSDAMRTRQTYVWISERLGDLAPTAYLDDRMYLGSSRGLCSIINETPEAVQTLLLVAHMPGVQDLAMELAGAHSDETAVLEMAQHWPPAGLAQLQVTKSWAELDGRDAALTRFVAV